MGALLSTLGLLFAIGVAVGGFVASPGPVQALAAVLPSSHLLSTTGAITSSEMPEPQVASRAAVPINELPFAATRLAEATVETPLVNTTAEDVVRSARATPAGPPKLQSGDRVRATVSFYYCRQSGSIRGDGGAFCGAMRDGSIVYNGAAACDYGYLGQRFRIEGDPSGRIYRCADTGSAVHGLHRDIWFATNEEGWAWQKSVGQSATIEIVP